MLSMQKAWTEMLIDDAGHLQFLEVKASVHKTARAFHLRHQFLPMAAPTHGVTSDNWGEQWIRVRKLLKIDDLSVYPLMPAPDSCLEPTKRPLSTQEAQLWTHEMLKGEMKPGSKVTSHSCKCTCLSMLAKRGASYDDRLVLGYHANAMKMALVYSRDSSARPLALLCHVLGEIRSGIFSPDDTRSGRLKEGAVSLDRVEAFSFNSHVAEQPGKETSDEPDVEDISEKSWQKVAEAEKPAGAPELEEEGHATTDSSNSSEGECAGESPVVGHYVISVPDDKAL